MLIYLLHPSFKNTQIEKAARLLEKFVREEEFWKLLAKEFYGRPYTDDLIYHEIEIRKHLRFMFNDVKAMVSIVPYKTKWAFSSVLGHADGATIHENTRKLNALTLAERVGHLGHETTHLFGYSHSEQGAEDSATVGFGQVMEKYAELRIKELGLS